jgi:hypothetical protein
MNQTQSTLALSVATIGTGVLLGLYLAESGDSPAEMRSVPAALSIKPPKAEPQRSGLPASAIGLPVSQNSPSLELEVKGLVRDLVGIEIDNIRILGGKQTGISPQKILEMMNELGKMLPPELFNKLKNFQQNGLMPNVLLATIDNLRNEDVTFTSTLVTQTLNVAERVINTARSSGVPEHEIRALLSESNTANGLLGCFLEEGELTENLSALDALANKYPRLYQQVELQTELTLANKYYALKRKALEKEIEVPGLPDSASLKDKAKFYQTLESELYRFSTFEDALRIHGITDKVLASDLLDRFLDPAHNSELYRFRDSTNYIFIEENQLRKARGIQATRLFGTDYSPEVDGPLQPETVQKLESLRNQLLQEIGSGN